MTSVRKLKLHSSDGEYSIVNVRVHAMWGPIRNWLENEVRYSQKIHNRHVLSTPRTADLDVPCRV